MIIFILLIGWIASAFFCASVAIEKGYSGTSWGIAGFLFGFFALIAVAGLPDKKLRKYLRQIGAKEQTNNEEIRLSEEKKVYRKKIISFVMPSGANKLQLFNKLKSEVKKNEEYKDIFDGFKIKTYDFNKSLLGGLEFVIEGDEDECLFIMSGKKLNDIQTEWTGTL